MSGVRQNPHSDPSECLSEGLSPAQSSLDATRGLLRASLFLGLGVLSGGQIQAAQDVRVEQVIDGNALAAQEVLKDTGAPYENLFRNAAPKFDNDVKTGPFTGDFGVSGLKGVGFSFPLINRGFRPEDALAKIGPLYLDISKIQGSVLVSDNVNLSPSNRKTGAIAISRMDVAARLQLNDGINAAIAGSLLWLPFTGDIGIAGFGVNDPTLIDWNLAPIFKTQLDAAFALGGWDFEVGDEFYARPVGQFRTGVEGWDIFKGEQFTEQDIAGRRVYQYTGGLKPTLDPSFRRDTGDFQLVNDAYIKTRHDAPMQTSFFAEAHHRNFWYNFTSPGFPDKQDMLNLKLRSERENMRFRPYVGHLWLRQTFKTSSGTFLNQLTYGGIDGPVSDNMQFSGMVGWFRTNRSNKDTIITVLNLEHQFHPLAQHGISYTRFVTEPDLLIANIYRYNLRHQFGPYTQIEYLLSKQHNESPSVAISGSDIYTAGMTIAFDLGDRTTLAGGYLYQNVDLTNPSAQDFNVHRARLSLDRKIRETVTASITYGYQDWSYTNRALDFYEHYMIFSLAKTF